MCLLLYFKKSKKKTRLKRKSRRIYVSGELAALIVEIFGSTGERPLESLATLFRVSLS
jgi:hypothetical protein